MNNSVATMERYGVSNKLETDNQPFHRCEALAAPSGSAFAAVAPLSPSIQLSPHSDWPNSSAIECQECQPVSHVSDSGRFPTHRMANGSGAVWWLECSVQARSFWRITT